MTEPLVCDCCHIEDSLNFYKHSAFIVVVQTPEDTQMIEFEAGEWAFCPLCADLFFSGQIEKLADRGVEFHHNLTHKSPSFYRALLMATYTRLLTCLQGAEA